MPNVTRSARGTFVDFELLAIRSQLSSKPVPKKVEERKLAIEEKEGIKPEASPAVNELLKVAAESAAASKEASKTIPKRK